MQFGISTHLYHQHRLGREHLLELAEFGFGQVELFATVGHFDYHDPAAIDQLAGWLAEAGLSLHSVHAPIVEHRLDGRWGPALSTAVANEPARKRAVAEAVAASAIASRLPYRYLVLHLGIPAPAEPTPGDNSPEAARRSLEEIASAAAPLGVKIAVEVIPNRISEAGRLVRLLEDDLDLPSPGAGICLDMGHAFLMGDVAEAIETVSGHLVTTHVHDNLGKEDDHLAPLDGEIDWPLAVMSLRKVGYEGAIVFEVADTGSPRTVLKRTVEARRRFEEILAE